MIFPAHGGLGKSFRSFALNPLLYADLYYANSFVFVFNSLFHRNHQSVLSLLLIKSRTLEFRCFLSIGKGCQNSGCRHQGICLPHSVLRDSSTYKVSVFLRFFFVFARVSKLFDGANHRSCNKTQPL